MCLWYACQEIFAVVCSITHSVLISPCFALHPYENQRLIKPEQVIVDYLNFVGSLVLKISWVAPYASSVLAWNNSFYDRGARPDRPVYDREVCQIGVGSDIRDICFVVRKEECHLITCILTCGLYNGSKTEGLLWPM